MTNAEARPSAAWEQRARRRWRRRSGLQIKRAALLGVGGTLVVAGIALAPTPIPIGFVLFVIGLAFLARGSRTARNGVKWARARLPRLSRGLNAIKPRVPAGVRRFIETSDPGL
ncbi:MAG: PGPGW domain-containing protein [Pseudomonadota bacterium]